MPERKITDYIKEQLRSGKSQEEIVNSLLAAGWPSEKIADAFKSLSGDLPPPSSKPPISDNRLPRVSELLKDSWQIYKSRFGVLMLVQAIPFVINLAFFGMIFAGAIIPVLTIIGTSLFTIWIIFGTVLASAAILYTIKDRGEKIGAREALRRGFKRYTAVLWTTILFTLLTGGAFMLFLVPGFLFAVWFGFSLFIAVSENLSGMNALLKSREYIRGLFWPIIGRSVVPFLVLIGIVFAVQFLITILVQNADALTRIVSAIIGFILGPFLGCYGFRLYEMVKSARGEIAFSPKISQKVAYWVIGILGLLAALIIAAFSVVIPMLFLKKITSENSPINWEANQIELPSRNQPPVVGIDEELENVSRQVEENAEKNKFELEPFHYAKGEARVIILVPKGWEKIEAFSFVQSPIDDVPGDIFAPRAEVSVITLRNGLVSVKQGDKWVEQQNTPDTLDEAVRKHIESRINDDKTLKRNYKLLDQQKVILADGTEGYIITSSETRTTKKYTVRSRTLLIVDSKYKYWIETEALEDAWGKYDGLFEKILLSFRREVST